MKRLKRERNRHGTREGADFEELQDLGFRLNPPDDTFSDQPDSSGTIGGRRGQQEFGIEGGVAGEDMKRDRDLAAVYVPYDEDNLDENDEGEVPTMSEWSAEHAAEDEDFISDEYAGRDEGTDPPVGRRNEKRTGR